jgi:hypothetical protein
MPRLDKRTGQWVKTEKEIARDAEKVNLLAKVAQQAEQIDILNAQTDMLNVMIGDIMMGGM